MDDQTKSLTLVVDSRKAIEGLRRVDQAFVRSTAAVDRFVGNIKSGFSIAERAISGVLLPFKALIGVQAALQAQTVALAAATLGAAGRYEMFTQQLRTVIASKKEADQAFRESIQFSVVTPFTPAEIIETRIALEGVGVRGAAAVEKTALAAAALNRNILDVARAVKSMETEPLRNLGIMLKRQGDDFLFSFTDKIGQAREIAATGFADAQQQLLDIFAGKFEGGLAKMALTWEGLVSTFKGAVFDLRAAFGEGFLNAAKLILNDIIEAIADIKEAAQAAGREFGAELMRARNVMMAGFDVALQVAKEIGAALGQENGLGTVIIEAIRLGTQLLADGLLAAFRASLSLWRAIGTILGQAVLDAFYQSGMPGAGMAREAAVASNLSRMPLSELNTLGREFGVSPNKMSIGMAGEAGPNLPRTASEYAKALAFEIGKLPIEQQLAYAHHNPQGAVQASIEKAGTDVRDSIAAMGELAVDGLQKFVNKITDFNKSAPIDLRKLFSQSLQARMGEGEEVMARWNKILNPAEGAVTVSGGGVRNEFAGFDAEIDASMVMAKEWYDQREQMKQQAQSMVHALDVEMKIIGRLGDSHERAAKMVAYENTVKVAYANDQETINRLMDEYSDKLKGLEKQHKLVQIADDIGNAFGRAFEDVALGAQKAGEAIKALGMDVARLVLRQLVTQPLAMSISTGVQGMFATKAHTGWKVGSPSPVMQMVDPAIFAGAPRLHGGLRYDEYPAILQRGEEVVSARDVQAGRSATLPQPVFNITNNSSSQVEVGQTSVQFDGRKMIVGMLLKDKRNRGPISRAERRR